MGTSPRLFQVVLCRELSGIRLELRWAQARGLGLLCRWCPARVTGAKVGVSLRAVDCTALAVPGRSSGDKIV